MLVDLETLGIVYHGRQRASYLASADKSKRQQDQQDDEGKQDKIPFCLFEDVKDIFADYE